MAPVPTQNDEQIFPPIAIIGRGCVLPGANTPDELWSRVLAGEDLLTSAPEGMWRIPHASVLCSPAAPSVDRTWSSRGGYVQGFADRFDPTGFALTKEELAGLDPLVLWVLHSAREALRSAGITPAASLRAGAVFGNLSYPVVLRSTRNRYGPGSRRSPTPDSRRRIRAIASCPDFPRTSWRKRWSYQPARSPWMPRVRPACMR